MRFSFKLLSKLAGNKCVLLIRVYHPPLLLTEWKALYCVVAFDPDFLFSSRKQKHFSNNPDLTT